VFRRERTPDGRRSTLDERVLDLCTEGDEGLDSLRRRAGVISS